MNRSLPAFHNTSITVTQAQREGINIDLEKVLQQSAGCRPIQPKQISIKLAWIGASRHERMTIQYPALYLKEYVGGVVTDWIPQGAAFARSLREFRHPNVINQKHI